MDSLTVAGTVLAVTARALTTVRTLDHLKRSYEDGPETISELFDHATAISSSLSLIQSLLLNPIVPESPELEFVCPLSIRFGGLNRLLILCHCCVGQHLTLRWRVV
jgi:hypothetical protein